MTDDATAERIRRLQERRGNAPSRATANGATPESPAPTVDVDAERAARLQRLQARRSGSAAATPVASAPSSLGTSVGAARPTPNRVTRRRHAAPRGRVLAAGLSASAFVGGMTTIAAHPKVWTTSASSALLPSTAANGTPTPAPSTTLPPVPPTVVVVKEVHHTVYVDQYGHPIAGTRVPVTTKRTSSVSGSTGAAPARRVSGSSTPAPTSASTGSLPVPASGTSSGSSTPPPASAPTPSPTTTAPPPPPPPPPTCSGSKC